ncbi:transposase domain-containing protein [Phthorimaea operculella]|nr:transposase domain-containing protein [Phthorimaea operculella]
MKIPRGRCQVPSANYDRLGHSVCVLSLQLRPAVPTRYSRRENRDRSSGSEQGRFTIGASGARAQGASLRGAARWPAFATVKKMHSSGALLQPVLVGCYNRRLVPPTQKSSVSDPPLNTTTDKGRRRVRRNTVKLWIRRYGETGSVQRNRTGPKPVMFTDQSERHRAIVAQHQEHPFATTRSTAVSHGVSVQTVRHHLHAAGFKTYKPARKIKLSPAHRQARVRFAQMYQNFDWINNVVIFTDEKVFKSDKDGKQILWRKKGQRYEESCMLPCRTSGRISLGYWGWMSSMGPGELIEVGAHFNSREYIEILRDVMLPSVRIAYPTQEIYFVQDNCSIHRAHIVRQWLEEQEGIHVIDWPSKSPDLNPIENLWGLMTLNWDPTEVRNKENLAAVVTSTWDFMRGRDHCWNMVNGMPGRLEQIVDKADLSYHITLIIPPTSHNTYFNKRQITKSNRVSETKNSWMHYSQCKLQWYLDGYLGCETQSFDNLYQSEYSVLTYRAGFTQTIYPFIDIPLTFTCGTCNAHYAALFDTCFKIQGEKELLVKLLNSLPKCTLSVFGRAVPYTSHAEFSHVAIHAPHNFVAFFRIRFVSKKVYREGEQPPLKTDPHILFMVISVGVFSFSREMSSEI